MTRTQASPPAPALEWVLIANAARARCFVRDADNGAMREDRGFVHPASRLKAMELSHDRGGKVHKSIASTRFAARTDEHDKERAAYARELAAFLEEAALAQRSRGLWLIASAEFPGELRTHPGPEGRERPREGFALDLSAYEGAQLEHHVTQALANTAIG